MVGVAAVYVVVAIQARLWGGNEEIEPAVVVVIPEGRRMRAHGHMKSVRRADIVVADGGVHDARPSASVVQVQQAAVNVAAAGAAIGAGGGTAQFRHRGGGRPHLAEPAPAVQTGQGHGQRGANGRAADDRPDLGDHQNN